MSILQAGRTSIDYSCDRCAILTGNPYAMVGWVLDGDPEGSNIEGWVFDNGHSYCPGCAQAMAALRNSDDAATAQEYDRRRRGRSRRPLRRCPRS
jgi:hypothetical protein